jgi:hypothetical protein
MPFPPRETMRGALIPNNVPPCQGKKEEVVNSWATTPPILIILGVTLASCSSDTAFHRGAAGESCRARNDCEVGLACINGVCIPGSVYFVPSLPLQEVLTGPALDRGSHVPLTASKPVQRNS